MNKIELLVPHGPPGSGKTSISQTACKLLRQRGITNAVIDLDHLAKVYPRDHIGIMYKTLLPSGRVIKKLAI